MSDVSETELARRVSEKTGITAKEADRIFDAYQSEIISAVAAGENVRMHRFGKFEPKVRKGRNVRNPNTGEMISYGDKNSVKFGMYSAFSDALKG